MDGRIEITEPSSPRHDLESSPRTKERPMQKSGSGETLFLFLLRLPIPTPLLGFFSRSIAPSIEDGKGAAPTSPVEYFTTLLLPFPACTLTRLSSNPPSPKSLHFVELGSSSGGGGGEKLRFLRKKKEPMTYYMHEVAGKDEKGLSHVRERERACKCNFNRRRESSASVFPRFAETGEKSFLLLPFHCHGHMVPSHGGRRQEAFSVRKKYTHNATYKRCLLCAVGRVGMRPERWKLPTLAGGPPILLSFFPLVPKCMESLSTGVWEKVAAIGRDRKRKTTSPRLPRLLQETLHKRRNAQASFGAPFEGKKSSFSENAHRVEKRTFNFSLPSPKK